MSHTPRVTVLMTVYNGTSYLPACLTSLLSQTFTDFELLILDDASTDASVHMIQSYRDPRIRLVVNPSNLGQAASLNKGLGLIRGEFVARMDQDDVCLPNRLKEQVAFLENHPDVAAVGTWVYWMNGEGEKTGVTGLAIGDFGAFLGILLGQMTPVGHATAMFRGKVLEKLGGYREAFAPCEDYDLWCRLALQRHLIGVIPRPLVMLRIHDQQQSATRLSLQRESARRAQEGLVAAFCKDQPPVHRVALLLRGGEDFWQETTSLSKVRQAVQELEDLLQTICRKLKLSPREERSLRTRLSWWLGRGACVAVLQGRSQSLPLYLYAWRVGLRMFRTPALLGYPLGLLLSPLVVPRVRRWIVHRTWALNRKQYGLRLAIENARQFLRKEA